jgi:hypothetical protein
LPGTAPRLWSRRTIASGLELDLLHFGTTLHDLAIPVIAEASGPVVDLFPRDIAPVTWLIIDQKPKLVYYGKLYPDHLEAIRAALNSLQNLPDSPE